MISGRSFTPKVRAGESTFPGLLDLSQWESTESFHHMIVSFIDLYCIKRQMEIYNNSMCMYNVLHFVTW